jgi:hypothetical protein
MNRRNTGGTYFQVAIAESDQVGGRWAAEVRTRVTGATPASQYPSLPEDAFPNQAAAVPASESLGFAIDQMDPVGEVFEVLAEQQGGEGVNAITPPGAKPSGELLCSGNRPQPDTVETSSSPPTRRRRKRR